MPAVCYDKSNYWQGRKRRMLKKILSRKTVIASLVSLAVLALGGGIWYIMIDRGFSLTDNPAQTVSISEVRAPEESLVYDDKITPLSLAVILISRLPGWIWWVKSLTGALPFIRPFAAPGHSKTILI